MQSIITRYANNPILCKEDVPFPVETVHNAGAVKHDGRYYLIYSGSGANTPDYAVGYATAQDPMGPFTRAAHNPILHRSEGVYGPGHGCAIRDPDGQWWFVYHQKASPRKAWDRFICLDPLHFDAEGRLHGQATRGR